jgi:hypothetical protein
LNRRRPASAGQFASWASRLRYTRLDGWQQYPQISADRLKNNYRADADSLRPADFHLSARCPGAEPRRIEAAVQYEAEAQIISHKWILKFISNLKFQDFL